MNWLISALTDNHGEFDVVQIVLPIAVFSIIGLSGWSLTKGQTFNAAELGTGIAAIIAALGAYKWGDSKSSRP